MSKTDYTALREHLACHEEWLMAGILDYAKRQGYARYTSTLAEAWRVSICGLSEPLIQAIDDGHTELELGPEDDFVTDPIAAFGVLQAQRHRSRGISLGLFLGLMKYYRQTYMDLLEQGDFPEAARRAYRVFLERFFDRVELGFAIEWSGHDESEKVAEMQSANRLMTNEKNKYLTIFESLNDPVFFVDEQGTIENLNRAAARVFAGLEGSGFHYYSPGQLDLAWPDAGALEQLTLHHASVNLEQELPTRGGDRWFEVKTVPMLDVSEKFSGTVIICHDVTERKEAEARIRHLAMTDPLTGLANRSHFDSSLDEALRSARRTNLSVGLVLIDLNKFKPVNDTYGHAVGDALLKEVAQRLTAEKRETDTVARLGGDEFAVILNHLDRAENADVPMNRIAERLSGSYTINDHELTVSASIGISLFPLDTANREELLRKADMAMYRNKESLGEINLR